MSISEQTERTVQAVDLMLAGLAESLAAAPGVPEHDAAFQDKMRTLVQSSPFIRALFVVGPDGSLTHGTNHPNTPRVSATTGTTSGLMPGVTISDCTSASPCGVAGWVHGSLA